jgi:peptide-methionine (R)-S-oxide reductase
MNKVIILSFFLSCFMCACAQKKPMETKGKKTAKNLKKDSFMQTNNNDSAFVPKTEAEYKAILPSEIYYVARQKGTERPWTSPLENLKDTGTFYCAVCGNGLFISTAKFESGCGWPSFFEPLTPNSVIYEADNSHGMERVEVMCSRCKSHLGHVFNDAPKTPTGKRYCINGVVLDFKKAQEAAKNFEAKKD